jgi:hypothetical protein
LYGCGIQQITKQTDKKFSPSVWKLMPMTYLEVIKPVNFSNEELG